MGNWAELGDDILGLIVDQFSAIEDIALFGVVCRQWRSVSVKKWHSFIVDPWLMLVEKEDSDSRGFYSLSTKKVYRLNLPEARGRKCCSSCGWLITLGLDFEIHLFNPFSRVQIRLPAQPALPDKYDPETEPEFIRQIFMKKVILSSRPSKRIPSENEDEKCVIMGIFSEFNKLGFLRLGDEVWTQVYTPEGIGISDVVYMNGQFYAFTNGGKLVTIDISSPDPKTIEFAEPPEGYNKCARFYLVESAGELFMLARDVFEGIEGEDGELHEEFEDDFGNEDEDDIENEDGIESEDEDDNEGEDEEGDEESEDDTVGTHNYDKYVSRTDSFDVYKFNFDNKQWTQVKDLDNRVLFVGDNASFAIFPSNHLGCEPNCIYFTDDDTIRLAKEFSEKGAGDDMGVFRMKTEKLDNHYVGPDTLTHISAPLWICPSM